MPFVRRSLPGGPLSIFPYSFYPLHGDGEWSHCPHSRALRIFALRSPYYSPFHLIGLSVSPVSSFSCPNLAVWLAAYFDSVEIFRFYLAVFAADYFGPMLQNSRNTDYRHNFYLRIPRNAAYSVDPNEHNSALLDFGSSDYLLSVARPRIFQESISPFLTTPKFLASFPFSALIPPHP